MSESRPEPLHVETVRDHVMAYIEATASAANRSRDIIVLMTIASVLIFGAFWNSRQASWLNRRVAVARNAIRVLQLRKTLVSGDASTERRASIIAELGRSEMVQAGDYIAVRGLSSDQALNRYVQALEQQQISNVMTLHIPVIGIAFDGLGLVGWYHVGNIDILAAILSLA